MNTIQRVIKNIGVLFVSQLLSYVFGFFTLIFSARYLGVEGFGVLSFAIAFTGIFSISMDLGLNTLIIREVARDKSIQKDYVANIITIKILISLLTFTLILLLLLLLGYDQQTKQVVYFIAIYTFFSAFSQMFYSIFQANEKMEYQSLGVILTSSFLLTGILLSIYFNLDLIQFSLIYAIVGLISLIYAISSYSIKFSIPKIKLNTNKWKCLISEAWPFAITNISINLYLWLDTVILSVIKGPDAVGLYNAAYRLIFVLLFIPAVFNNAVFPLMSKYHITSKNALKFTFEKLFKIMILIGVPLGIGTMLIANKLISLIYGNQFIGTVIALQILIWSSVLIFVRSPFERLLESTNKQLLITKIFIIGVIFNVTLNLIFIPRFSYIGAATITVLTDALVLSLLIYITKKFNIYFLKEIKTDIFKIIAASLIMGLVLKYFSNLEVGILIIIGIITYIILLLLLKIINDEEFLIIKSIFWRDKSLNARFAEIQKIIKILILKK